MAGKKKVARKQTKKKTRNAAKPADAALVPQPSFSSAEVVDIPGEIIEKLPPEQREVLQSFVAMISRSGYEPRHHPLLEKFMPEHIDKYLDGIQKDEENEFKYKSTNRWFNLAYSVLAILVFGAGVVFLLPRNSDLLVQLITILVILAGGLGTGYGLSKRK